MGKWENECRPWPAIGNWFAEAWSQIQGYQSTNFIDFDGHSFQVYIFPASD